MVYVMILVRYVYASSLVAPLTVYADDKMLMLSLTNKQQLTGILEIFEDFYRVSGLKLNIKKN